MAIADAVNGLIKLLNKYWYILVIAILGFLVIHFFLKDQKDRKPQYYSQVEVNRRLKFKDLQFNPTPFKMFINKEKKYRVYGLIARAYFKSNKPEIKQMVVREYSAIELKNMDLASIKEQIKGAKPEYIIYDWLVKTKHLFFGLFIGGYECIRIKNGTFAVLSTEAVRLNDNIYLLYRDGFFVESTFDLIAIQSEDSERLSGDLKLDGLGSEQK